VPRTGAKGLTRNATIEERLRQDGTTEVCHQEKNKGNKEKNPFGPKTRNKKSYQKWEREYRKKEKKETAARLKKNVVMLWDTMRVSKKNEKRATERTIAKIYWGEKRPSD